MDIIKLRIAINLHEGSIGFQPLVKELRTIGDAKKQRMRVLEILHDYSLGLSNQHVLRPAFQMEAAKSNNFSALQMELPNLNLSPSDTIETEHISDAEAVRRATAEAGIEWS